MSDRQYQYTSNKNQFQNDYDGRKTLYVDIKYTFFCIITYFSKRKDRLFCIAADKERCFNRIIHEQPELIILVALANTKLQY